MKQKFLLWVVTFLMVCPCVVAGSCCNAAKPPTDCNAVPLASETTALDAILKNIGNASLSLNTLECDLSYLFIQDPELIDSKALRTGKLHYQKDNGRSRLRIRFERLRQDDFEPEEYVEDYYFDGVWLTKVDYKLEQIDLYQQAPEGKPVDVFELVNHHFPLIGFSGADALQKDFEISLVNADGNDPNSPIQLLLNVKKTSKYQEEYEKIDFWINRGDYLPLRVKTYSTRGDIYDIQFLGIQTNKKLKNAVFTIETPVNFSKNIQPLETTSQTKGN